MSRASGFRPPQHPIPNGTGVDNADLRRSSPRKPRHAHQFPEDLVVSQLLNARPCCDHRLALSRPKVAAADDVTDCVQETEGLAYIEAWGMSVRVYTPGPNDMVVRLKSFRGKEKGRTESTDMPREVDNNVEFRLVEPSRIPEGRCFEKVGYRLGESDLVD